jgi:hypothetical protein
MDAEVEPTDTAACVQGYSCFRPRSSTWGGGMSKFSADLGPRRAAGRDISGSPKVARCVEVVYETPFGVPTSRRRRGLLPRYGWRHCSLYEALLQPSQPPQNPTQFQQVACTLDEPLSLFIIIIFFRSVFCLFWWRGMNSPYCKWLTGTAPSPTNLYFCYWGWKGHLTSAMIFHPDVYMDPNAWALSMGLSD